VPVPDSRQIDRYRAKASATISTLDCASGGVAPSVRKSDTLRSRFSGCQTRFSPMPTMTVSADRSNNIPHNFDPSRERMSFGHFREMWTCGAICRMASNTANAVTNARLAGAGSVSRKRTMVLANRLPFGLSQLRPRRPLPPSCASARSHNPSGAPCAARVNKSAFVDPVSATSSNISVRTAPLLQPLSKRRALEWQNTQGASWPRQEYHRSRPTLCHRFRR